MFLSCLGKRPAEDALPTKKRSANRRRTGSTSEHHTQRALLNDASRLGMTAALIPPTHRSFRHHLGPLDDDAVWGHLAPAGNSGRRDWLPYAASRADLRGSHQDGTRSRRLESWDVLWRTAPTDGKRTVRELARHLWPDRTVRARLLRSRARMNLLTRIMAAPAESHGGGGELSVTVDDVLDLRRAAHYVLGLSDDAVAHQVGAATVAVTSSSTSSTGTSSSSSSITMSGGREFRQPGAQN